jgi:hypothetical protein
MAITEVHQWKLPSWNGLLLGMKRIYESDSWLNTMTLNFFYLKSPSFYDIANLSIFLYISVSYDIHA